MKVGDIVTVVAGKPVKDQESLDAVLAEADPKRGIKIAFQRPKDAKSWKGDTVSMKPVALEALLTGAMEAHTDPVTKLTTYAV